MNNGTISRASEILHLRTSVDKGMLLVFSFKVFFESIALKVYGGFDANVLPRDACVLCGVFACVRARGERVALGVSISRVH